MTDTNREGSLVTVNTIRQAVKTRMLASAEPDALGTWLSYYMAEAERAEGITEGTIQRPRSWQMPADRTKWPETALPCVLIIVPGMNGAPQGRGEGLVTAPFAVEFGAVVRGIDDDDTWQQASIYGAALRDFGAKQLEQIAGIDVEGVAWDSSGEGYDDISQAEGRSLRMASLGFTLTVNGVVSRWPGVAAVPSSPLGDVGDYPAAVTVTVGGHRMDD